MSKEQTVTDLNAALVRCAKVLEEELGKDAGVMLIVGTGELVAHLSNLGGSRAAAMAEVQGYISTWLREMAEGTHGEGTVLRGRDH